MRVHLREIYLEIFSTPSKVTRTSLLDQVASFVKRLRNIKFNYEKVRCAQAICSESQFLTNYVQRTLQKLLNRF